MRSSEWRPRRSAHGASAVALQRSIVRRFGSSWRSDGAPPAPTVGGTLSRAGADSRSGSTATARTSTRARRRPPVMRDARDGRVEVVARARRCRRLRHGLRSLLPFVFAATSPSPTPSVCHQGRGLRSFGWQAWTNAWTSETWSVRWIARWHEAHRTAKSSLRTVREPPSSSLLNGVRW